MDKHNGKWNDYMKFTWCHVSCTRIALCKPTLNLCDVFQSSIFGITDRGKLGDRSPEGCNRRKLSFQGKLTFQYARSLISPSLCFAFFLSISIRFLNAKINKHLLETLTIVLSSSNNCSSRILCIPVV